MARYIVRPKSPGVASTVSLASTTLTPSRRSTQLKALTNARSEDPVVGELELWLDEASEKVSRLSNGRPLNPAGTLVLEMSEEDASQLERDLESLLILHSSGPAA